MSLPANFVEIDWSTIQSNGNYVCSACKKEIPQGRTVHIRDGRKCSPTAYPHDPSIFCEPCVLPDEKI